MLRKFLILPSFTFGILAFFNLITGDFFHFYLWLTLVLISTAAVAPILINAEKRFIPVFHIVSAFFIFIFFFSFATFFDFRQEAGISFAEAFLFGISVGTIIVAMIMVIKGK